MNGCKLSPVALGLAFGILMGVSLLIAGLVATYFSDGQNFVITLGAIGYTPSIAISFLSALIVFIDAFIIGFLVGWLYNKFSSCSCMCCDKGKKVKIK